MNKSRIGLMGMAALVVLSVVIAGTPRNDKGQRQNDLGRPIHHASSAISCYTTYLTCESLEAQILLAERASLS